MKFVFKVWVLSIEVDLFDLDPSDGDIKIGIKVSWR